MNSSQNHNDRKSRINKVRDIVMEDLSRIDSAQSPYMVLNSRESEAIDVIEERYDKYERFYRPENFQRLGDIDLTRKALDIRRMLGHAIEEIRRDRERRDTLDGGYSSVSMQQSEVSVSRVSEDEQALGDIYFRDAMAYIQLGDLNEAYELLRVSVEFDNQRGLSLAYMGYMTFKRRAYIPNAIEEAKRLLDEAAFLSPEDCDVFVLRGRFFARLGDLESLMGAIAHIESMDPTHPMLDRLQRKVRQLQ